MPAGIVIDHHKLWLINGERRNKNLPLIRGEEEEVKFGKQENETTNEFDWVTNVRRC